MSDVLVYRVLNEIESMLSYVLDHVPLPGTRSNVSRYELAVWRLTDEATPGFSSRTPGNGDPGGGKGANVTSSGTDDTIGPDANTQPERLALGLTSAELDDLARLRRTPARLVVATFVTARAAGLDTHVPAADRPTALAWCADLVHTILDDPYYVSTVSTRDHTAMHRHTDELRRLVKRWGYSPSTPESKAVDLELLAHDPTETQCRSCLRVGRREPRYRGDLCRWCYEFNSAEGFIPPAEIIEARGSYKKVTEAMVAPHRQRHRDRMAAKNGKPRRRKGARS